MPGYGEPCVREERGDGNPRVLGAEDGSLIFDEREYDIPLLNVYSDSTQSGSPPSLQAMGYNEFNLVAGDNPRLG